MIDQRVETAVQAPFMRYLLRQEDGTYIAKIVEFPGIIAEGDTPDAAMESVDDALQGVVETMLEDHEEIPIPVSEREFSGRLVLRMPPSLHERAAIASKLEGVSLNRYLSNAVAFYVGIGHLPRRSSDLADFVQGVVSTDLPSSTAGTPAMYRSAELAASVPELLILWSRLLPETQSELLRDLRSSYAPLPGGTVSIVGEIDTQEEELVVFWRFLSPEERASFHERVRVLVAADR